MLTIGQVAKFAGVTIRAVRHYHQKGLLPEPERDVSGYRRYGAQDAVDLVKIRTLAEAGVPLARVRELMTADEQAFSSALIDIDHQLGADIKRLQHSRQQIKRLAGGEALGLPDYVVGFLARMREFGVGEEAVAVERDAWIIVSAHEPEKAKEWVTRKSAMFDDPEFASVYRGLSDAAQWKPDDPRLDDLAERMAAYAQHQDARESDEVLDPALVKLLNDMTMAAVPTWQTLGDLIVKRLSNQ